MLEMINYQMFVNHPIIYQQYPYLVCFLLSVSQNVYAYSRTIYVLFQIASIDIESS